MSFNTDILIIGAGPAGTVAAAAAHQQGHQVTILEKQKFPRFIIGESLLPKCMEHLEEVGMIDLLSKRQYQIKRGVQFLRGDEVCWFNFNDQYTDGWTWTWQVPRDDFDTVLAEEVERRGVDIRYQHTVIDVKFH